MRAQARGHRDAKRFDLYAAALEIDSSAPQPEQMSIAKEIRDLWENGEEVRSDERTIGEAKLGLVHRFGAAVRHAEHINARSRSDGLAPREPVDLPYDVLFEIGVHEPSHPVRVAIAQEISAGGDAAYAKLRNKYAVHRDPVQQYLNDVRCRKRRHDNLRKRFLAGASERRARGGPAGAEEQRRRLQEIADDCAEDYAEAWREFVLRAHLLPMAVGSVSAKYRDEVKERLEIWLEHLAPAESRLLPSMPDAARGEPDLPLSLENALAQGFKNAANRRTKHRDVSDETRTYLVEKAEKMLTRSRYWYAQLSLLHALCLWALPDSVVSAPGGGAGAARRRRNAGRPPAGQGLGGRTAADRGDPVQAVARWLSITGSAHESPAAKGPLQRTRAHRSLHPFVAEAADLVTLALETGHPERFLWIDENGAIEDVGSTPGDPERYRKHNLWIAPSVGWSVLHPRAQRLVADVLVMLNLTERDGAPGEVEERLARANKRSLPPCLTHDRRPLHPERSVGRATEDQPGSTCLSSCRFRLCPYPPKAGHGRTEIEEPFCRQQQALLHSRTRFHLPAVSRRTPPWVSIPVRQLDRFWDLMSHRNRTSSGDDPNVV